MKRKWVVVLTAAIVLTVGANVTPIAVHAEDNNNTESASVDEKSVVKEVSVIGYENRYVQTVYNGEAQGLYAGVYDTKGQKFADAILYYVGVDCKYFSTEKPVDAGRYQVTASYKGDSSHLPAVDVYAMLIINKAQEAIVQIHDITTELDSTDPIEYTYSTTNVADKDIETILSSIACEGSDATIGQHSINGVANEDVAKNYEKVTVIPGTHTIIAKEETDVPVDPEEPTDLDGPTTPEEPTESEKPVALFDDNTEKVTNGDTEKETEIVKTGDNAPVGALTVGMTAALGIAVEILFRKRK